MPKSSRFPNFSAQREGEKGDRHHEGIWMILTIIVERTISPDT